MTATNPAYKIGRRSLAGEEAEWAKMFDPPTASPQTPEALTPTNPVPAYIAATIKGAKESIPATVRRTLLHNTDITMWDGKKVRFFTFADPDIPLASSGVYPAPTIRVPRGCIFHGWTTAQGPPPHTIHWHGIEPTPMNDGVGHCSMELGTYTYQWQPNFIGTYFCHCHRNTVQHFEFGLFGMLLIDPPDAFQGANGTGIDGLHRTAANTAAFPQFPGFNPLPVSSMDPHAMTVPYDVEALWVLDDVDSVWRSLAADAKSFYPAHGSKPGTNDTFYHGFFHDFNPDYFFVTGQPVPAKAGSTSTASIAPGIVIPPDFNSGVSGQQVSINAARNQTILIRTLCAAYVKTLISFPLDVVIIAFDGRALGVPPFGNYNSAFLLKAGTKIELSTARRFDALARSAVALNSSATIEYRSPRNNALLMTAKIPIVIN